MPVQSLTPEQREKLRKVGITLSFDHNSVRFSFQEGTVKEHGHNGCSLDEAIEVLRKIKELSGK